MTSKSLYVFGKKNPIRVAAVYTITNKYFDNFILGVILLNCITLAMYSHKPGFDDSELGRFLAAFEYCFLAVFSIEMVLKIIAMGLVAGAGTYLRNGWNVLDATVVSLGFLDIVMAGSSYTALRAVRVLRPLRTITHIKGLRVPVVTLLHALPMLMDVGVLFLFALVLFGIVAVQMFAGVLRNRCAAADFNSAYLVNSSTGGSPFYMNVSYQLPLSDTDQQCSGYLASEITWTQPAVSSNSSSSPVWSGGKAGDGWACPTDPDSAAAAPYGMFCAQFGNPNNGMTSFDNVLWAWLTIFQCITQEGWTDVLYWMQDAVSPWVLVYFIVLIVFGSFFLVNLALAVLYLQFTKEFSMAPSASSAVTRSASLAAGQASQKLQCLHDEGLPEQSEHVRMSPDDYDFDDMPVSAVGTPRRILRPSADGGHTQRGSNNSSSCGGTARQTPNVTVDGSNADSALPGGSNSSSSSGGGGRNRSKDGHAGLGGDGFVTAEITLSSRNTAATAAGILPPLDLKQLEQPLAGGAARKHTAHVSSKQQAQGQHVQQQQQQQQQQPAHAVFGAVHYCGAAWRGMRHCCKEIIQSGWFGLLNMLIILANTGVMAAYSYPMDPAWDHASEVLNIAFSLYFVLELLLKVMGLGPRAYIRDRINQFDALVVVASLVEIAVFLAPGTTANTSSMSVLRTARLMRVLKLARSWKELNRIISTIARSFSQVLYLSLLLLLFVFIFALMGMQLFGYRFSGCSVPGSKQLCPPGLDPGRDCPSYPDCYVPCDEGQRFAWFGVPGSPYNGKAFCEQFPRNGSHWGSVPDAAAAPNGTFQYWAQVGKASVPDSRFDNIGWALLTVFQLVTNENWNNVMYSAMSATSPAASLWFIAAIIVGNYVLLNLFLAVLLENFASPVDNSSGGASSRGNSSGSTLAAAAKAALLLSWMKELLETSWVAKLVRHDSNKVHALGKGRGSSSDDWAVSAPSSPRAEAVAHKAPHQEKLGNSRLAVSPNVAGIPLDTFVHLSSIGSPALHVGHHGTAVAASGAAGDGWVEQRETSLMQLSPRGLHSPAVGHRFSALVAPPKSSGNLLSSMLGSRHASFAAVAPSSLSVTRFNKVHPGAGLSGPAAGFGVEASRGSYSAALLQGNVDLLLARSPAAQAGTGAQRPSLDIKMLAGNQMGAGCSRGSMLGDKSAATLAGPGGYSTAGHGSMKGAASGYWEQDANPSHVNAPSLNLVGTSCCVLGPNNWLRLKLAQLVSHRHFENTILLLIFLSSVTLALEMPSLDHGGLFWQTLETMDMVFVVLFALEALVKVLVRGFLINGRGSYLRSPWNVLDFATVIIGVLMMAITLAGGNVHSLGSLRALRTLRALRPLRVASRLEGMKVVVDSLFASLPPLGNVVLVCLLFYLMFGIMGVHLLAGMLHSCQNPDGAMYDAVYVLPPGQHITREWCENSTLQVTTSSYHAGINVTMPAYKPQRTWVNQVANFDNILSAILTLFSISTTELWVNTMYGSIAAVGIDQQPRDGYSPALALYFVVFVTFGGYLVLQMFVAVTIEKFAEMHRKKGTHVLLTQQQEEWLSIQRMMADVKLKAQPVAPANSPWRAAVFKVAMSAQCELLVMAVIVCNVLVMAATHADMSEGWQAFMSYANLAFTAFFVAEAVIKCVALGIKQYLKDGWCRFDLLVVLVSVAGVAVDLGTPHDLQLLPLLRVLRVVRVFRLIPKAQGLRNLLQTLVFSLPALGNVGSVLFLFFFIYAVIGMNLFGAVKFGQYLNRHANFSNVGIALLTLFRMITGESWNGIMQDCMTTSSCMEVLQDVTLPGDGTSASISIAAGSWLDAGDALVAQIPVELVDNHCTPAPIGAVIYFVSFVLLCGLVLVNFVIGVIIDNMQSSSADREMPISRHHVEEFVRVWSELDPHASQYIPAVELSTLIGELLPPLGVKGEDGERSKIQSIIMAIDIPIRKNKVHFLEALHALAGWVAGTEVPEGEEAKVHQRLHPRLPSADPQDAPKYTVAHFYAALYVQAAVRGFLRRHALRGAGLISGVHDLPRGIGLSDDDDAGDGDEDDS